ncbi:Golgin subfamily A member 5 [Nymphon striatum]|nr:Golgin subfamily A member 5 [Nymphon striatum]
MSWFTDIAGKAEHFLNKVDQGAASALQLQAEKQQGIYNSKPVTSAYIETPVNNKKTSTSKNFSVDQPKLEQNSSFPKNQNYKTKVKLKNREDDDKLLEYLNNSNANELDADKNVKRNLIEDDKNSEKINSLNTKKVDRTHETKIDINEDTPQNPEKSTRNEAKASCRKAKYEFEHNLALEVKDNPKAFWSYIDDSRCLAMSDTLLSIRYSFSVELEGFKQNNDVPEANGNGKEIGNHLQIQSLEASETTNSTESSIELENKFLKKEMTSLNQEIGSVLTRAKYAETEVKDFKSRIAAQNSQIFNTEKKIKDLEYKESDFKEALKAKDSQIAVLRVRIEESDQELRSKQKILLKDHSDSSGLQNQALDTLKLKLTDAENALKLEKESLKCATVSMLKDASDRLNKLEDERKNMAVSLNSVEKQLADEKAKSSELAESYRTKKLLLDQAVTELNEYKQKAQRILQTKDKLIASLKDEKSIHGDSTNGMSASVDELEELCHERDSLRDELNQSIIRVRDLQSEIIEIESALQNEMDVMQKQINSNEEQISQHLQLQKDFEQENSQLKQELTYLREDVTRSKTTLQSRLKDRDLDIEKLRKQKYAVNGNLGNGVDAEFVTCCHVWHSLKGSGWYIIKETSILFLKVTARAISNSTEAELEARVHSLTESLIQKQTILEAMSTEKNSLNLQLERLENEMKESRTYSKRSHLVVGINEADEVKAKVPIFLRESPFDGNITRKVKRAYNSIDVFSVRVGVFLRKYPIARVFILIYMLLLHLWVFVVLTTYSPETHSSNYNPQPPPNNG